MKNSSISLRDNMVNFITAKLYHDLLFTTNKETANKTFYALIKAYNEWQDAVKHGVDYLFSLNDKDDLICAIKGGLNSEDIAQMSKDKKDFGMTEYFFFGENHENAEQLTMEQVHSVIITNIDAIVSYILAYGAEDNTESFKFIYNSYIATLFDTAE